LLAVSVIWVCFSPEDLTCIAEYPHHMEHENTVHVESLDLEYVILHHQQIPCSFSSYLPKPTFCSIVLHSHFIGVNLICCDQLTSLSVGSDRPAFKRPRQDADRVRDPSTDPTNPIAQLPFDQPRGHQMLSMRCRGLIILSSTKQ
jgi:hypothetical protein